MFSAMLFSPRHRDLIIPEDRREAETLRERGKKKKKIFVLSPNFRVMWWYSCEFVSDPCNPMDCSQPGSFVHGVSQARTLKLVAISLSRGSSLPKV